MYFADVQKLAKAAVKKCEFLERSIPNYLILSAFAGIYVAFGIGLILYLGAPLAAGGSPITKLVMGASFGIALSLVIFAGSELFTGNNMFGVVGALNGDISYARMAKLWFWCYAGNLLGSLFLAWLLAQSGLYTGVQADFVQKVTAAKMNGGLWELFVRAILANWLVCLAVWTASRTESDTAKLVLIFWCLFGFIAPGFEHCVANMSLMGLGLFLPHGDTVTWMGYARNLFATTAGNIVGGGLLVGGLYWLACPDPAAATAPIRSSSKARATLGAAAAD